MKSSVKINVSRTVLLTRLKNLQRRLLFVDMNRKNKLTKFDGCSCFIVGGWKRHELSQKSDVQVVRLYYIHENFVPENANIK